MGRRASARSRGAGAARGCSRSGFPCTGAGERRLLALRMKSLQGREDRSRLVRAQCVVGWVPPVDARDPYLRRSGHRATRCRREQPQFVEQGHHLVRADRHRPPIVESKRDVVQRHASRSARATSVTNDPSRRPARAERRLSAASNSLAGSNVAQTRRYARHGSDGLVGCTFERREGTSLPSTLPRSRSRAALRARIRDR